MIYAGCPSMTRVASSLVGRMYVLNVLCGQPDPNHQDCSGKFLLNDSKQSSWLGEPLVPDTDLCSPTLAHCIWNIHPKQGQSDVGNFGHTKPMGGTLRNPPDTWSKMLTQNNQSPCWPSLLVHRSEYDTKKRGRCKLTVFSWTRPYPCGELGAPVTNYVFGDTILP